jgi:hypothetical protein
MTSSLNYFVKDPDAILDYTVDWLNWLCSDTIVTGTWVVPAGITRISNSITTTTCSIWLSGGTNGMSYNLTNRIITTGGRNDDRTVSVMVREK